MSIVADIIESTKAIIKGMSVTFAKIPQEKWTVEYPDDPVTLQPRFRGQHLLHVDELGREKCVACFLCAAACPSDCIYIVAADDPRPPEERTGVDERYASVYNIDYGRCIFCGFCV
ncbi:MAG: NADH-quinone oxidoreductase subunit I, partial [Acidobacteriota bacterium]|nr:NADH-quinone oxidoreductase subunit I [Acidobacteriota bacterium]